MTVSCEAQCAATPVHIHASPHAEAIEAIRLEVKKQSALDEAEDDECIEVEAKLAAHTHAKI